MKMNQEEHEWNANEFLKMSPHEIISKEMVDRTQLADQLYHTKADNDDVEAIAQIIESYRPDYKDKSINFKEFPIKKIKHQIQQKFNQGFFERFRIGKAYDQITDMITIELEAWIKYGQIETFHVEYPVTWWDAFKDRFFPVWLLDRFPAEYNNIHIDLAMLIKKNDYPTSDNFLYTLMIKNEKELS